MSRGRVTQALPAQCDGYLVIEQGDATAIAAQVEHHHQRLLSELARVHDFAPGLMYTANGRRAARPPL